MLAQLVRLDWIKKKATQMYDLPSEHNCITTKQIPIRHIAFNVLEVRTDVSKHSLVSASLMWYIDIIQYSARMLEYLMTMLHFASLQAFFVFNPSMRRWKMSEDDLLLAFGWRWLSVYLLN